MSRSIRVSEASYAALVARAGAERRTITAVVEELVWAGAVAMPTADGQPSAVPPAQPSVAGVPYMDDDGVIRELVISGVPSLPSPRMAPGTVLARCPTCRCLTTQHQRGTQGDRCEVHPGCRWTP